MIFLPPIPASSRPPMSTPPIADALHLLVADFNRRISLLQELSSNPAVPSASYLADLASIHVALRGMEQQLQVVKAYLRAETEALPKAKALIGILSQQELRLKYMSTHFPSQLPASKYILEQTASTDDKGYNDNLSKTAEHANCKEKKGRSPPRWYITANELDSLSSYMRGRLTIDKLNAAIDEMATYAEATARLLAAPRKKLGEDLLEKALELRDVAAADAVKGKHFFLESDLRGPILKLDNTGKAILMVFRHLGRILEVRAGRYRAFVLLKS